MGPVQASEMTGGSAELVAAGALGGSLGLGRPDGPPDAAAVGSGALVASPAADGVPWLGASVVMGVWAGEALGLGPPGEPQAESSRATVATTMTEILSMLRIIGSSR